MSTTVINSALGYLYWIIAARTYPAHDVGLAAALLAIITLASSISSVGTGPTLVQILPQRAPGKPWSLTLNAALGTGGLLGLAAGGVCVLMFPLVSHQFSIVQHDPLYAAVLILGVALWTTSLLLDQTFIAERAAGNMLARNVIFAVLKVFLLVLFYVLLNAGAFGIVSSWILASAVASMVAFAFLIPRLHRNYNPALRGIVGQVRSMVASFAGQHFVTIGGEAPMYLLPTLVAARLSATDNAYFYTTWMLGNLFFLVSPAVAASLFAEGSHAAAGLARKARFSALIIGSLMTPPMLLFLFGGRYIMSVFGPAYPKHGLLLLMLLTVSAVPDAITNVYVSVLRVRSRLRFAALLNLGMAAFTLVAAWYLLPGLGIAGVGWAWLTAQVLGSTVVGLDLMISK